MSSGFPSDGLRLLRLSAAFHLAELSLTTTHCCSCSFGLQAAYMLLSGTSINHRVKTEQLSDIRGKPEDVFTIKYDPVLLKLLICATNYHASLSFVFEVAVKLSIVNFTLYYEYISDVAGYVSCIPDA